jgi:NADH:ubiquinone oxidoreductase subunit F (NADH-binding)
MSRNIRNLSARKGLEDNLFEHLGETVRPEGADFESISDEFLIGKATAYGNASFYDFLNPEKAGKKAFVCSGSACLLAGTQDAIHQSLCGHFNESEVGEAYCLGRCYENRAFHINGQNYSGKDADQIPDILAGKQIESDPYQVSSTGSGILSTHAPDFDTCLEQLKMLLNRDCDDLLREIDQSGLRGRGGAGFPIAIKLAAVQKEQADKKYIVCNADEGDPGAFSDRYLLEERPHLVLAGMALAGYITGAEEGVVYIRAEYPESIAIQRAAIQRFNALFPFRKENGEEIRFKLFVIKAQGAYICGEETALLNSIEGNRAEVRTRPPFPAQYGLYGKPTAVNNVETLAALPFVCQAGGEVFKKIGTEKSSGTKLISLDSHFNKPGLLEVDMGTPLATVVHELGGGFKVPVKAMHIGGPLGGLVPVSKINDLNISFESFATGGFLLGHASVICIPERFPMAKYIEHLFAFTAHESCGKCFPCRLGSTRGKELFQKAQSSDYRIPRELLNDLLETLEKGSLCALGGGLPLPVRNALMYFEEELKNCLEDR